MSKFNRLKNTRKRKDCILIITEGYTEKIYFKQYNRNLKSNKISITVKTPDNDTDPHKIVEYAVNEINRSFDKKIFTKIFCVFDTDVIAKNKNNKNNYANAIKLASKYKIDLITSFPCFELWFLLHFSHYNRPGKECNLIIKELKKIIPSYPENKNKYELEKINFCDTYSGKLNLAIEHAKKLELKNDSGGDYPHTEIYKIIEALNDSKRD